MDRLKKADSFLRRKDVIICISVCICPEIRDKADLEGLFCPFAHRANLVRHLKGLTEIVPISIVKPYPKGDDKGWPGMSPSAMLDPAMGVQANQPTRMEISILRRPI